MALYVQYHRNGAKVEFTDIDMEMCEHFDAPVDDIKFYQGWVDSVGFYHATGRTAAAGDFDDWLEVKPIADWLEANFEIKRWAGR